MTHFNPDNKKVLTFGEALDPILQVIDREDAMQYRQAYIKYQEQFKKDFTEGNTAESIVDTNIGYYAGYGTTEQMRRVQELFSVSHPILGKA